VAQTACVQNRAWQKGGLPPLRIAINISARQMSDKGLVAFLSETIKKTGLTVESLELEITESAVMSNQEHAEKVLNELKGLGFHLTMDDFGTGYSSLAYLKRFPFDSVKIDQSFVRGIPESKDDEAIVEAIIAMAHSLQLKVVAEGVETKEQYDFLRTLGCDQIQGITSASRSVQRNRHAALQDHDPRSRRRDSGGGGSRRGQGGGNGDSGGKRGDGDAG